jgi:cyclic pyranopterin phosphate synthase
VSGLTHLDADGRARMVDVSSKAETHRVAIAEGRLITRPDVVALVRADDLPKADVLATARIAGISGSKRTSELIPLCHPLPLDSVSVDFELGEDSIGIRVRASTTGRTGVEMEALTAVAIAGLTLHDMIKAVDPEATLTDVRLVEKTGGKRGHWTRGQAADVESPTAPLRPGSAVVLVSSTRAAAGVRDDSTGPLLEAGLAALGLAVDPARVVSDADLGAALRDALETRPALIVTTGGTGVSPTDRTPDATLPLLDRELPGVAEAIRARGLLATPTAALSRAVAGVARGTVVVNLPGSPGAVRDGLAVLGDLLPHLLDQVAGGDHRA